MPKTIPNLRKGRKMKIFPELYLKIRSKSRKTFTSKALQTPLLRWTKNGFPEKLWGTKTLQIQDATCHSSEQLRNSHDDVMYSSRQMNTSSHAQHVYSIRIKFKLRKFTKCSNPHTTSSRVRVGFTLNTLDVATAFMCYLELWGRTRLLVNICLAWLHPYRTIPGLALKGHTV